MKLVATYREDRTVRRVYDAAKTPLQRLLLSGILTDSRASTLEAQARTLDPLRLFQAVDQLQQAVLQCGINKSAACPPSPAAATALLSFRIDTCTTKAPESSGGLFPSRAAPSQDQEPPKNAPVLDWRRTSKDPFAGQWESICALVQERPSRSSGEIFRELQSLYPESYHPSHLRTLQRGVRKIRAQLAPMQEAPRPCEGNQDGQGTVKSPHLGVQGNRI